MVKPGIYTVTGELTTLQPGDIVRLELSSQCITISRNSQNLRNGWDTDNTYFRPNGRGNDDKFPCGYDCVDIFHLVELMTIAAGFWFEPVPTNELEHAMRITEWPK